MERRKFIKNTATLSAGLSIVGTNTFCSTKNLQKEGMIDESWFCKSLAKKGKRILADQAGWNVWGCSPIYDNQGKVHVFFSRWPGDHGNWLDKSEIAHAVADHPEGPYTVLGTVLKGRGKGYWDADTIHNPNIQKVGNQYVLTYIGNNISRGEMHRERAKYANTQKIGIAVADSLEGPWKRISDEPIINTSANPKNWDEYCVVNPSLLVHPNGQFWLYYRAWDRNNDNMRKTGVAIADKLEGPYIKHAQNPLLNNQQYKANAQSEDPYIFYYKGKFHCIIKDMGLQNYHSGLYHVSDDGINWSAPQQAYHTSENYFNEERQRFERPQILMKDGKPEYLFCALMGGAHHSSGAVLRVNV